MSNSTENLNCQIYLITPPKIGDIEAFAKQLKLALAAAPTDAPVACLQLRLKDTPVPEIIAAAKHLLPIMEQFGGLLIINDSAQIAAACGAHGVHLGQGDGSITNAKELLSPDAVIGITCHNSKDLAFQAANSGADYVAFGPFFPSATKPQAHIMHGPAELEVLSWWHEAVEIPSVAIGGITPSNAKAVIAAGADFIALSSAVWDHKDGPGAAIKALSALCAQHSPR